jgi:glycosyltransferase involved in cell wall biosynthesis
MRTFQPLVTIGISTYNRADGYLREALGSALAQTYPNLEIVVSDNCSTDRTEELVQGFADPRIRYFRQPRNIGANNNFNFCLQEARGEYFLLLHDDDRVDADFVASCIDALQGTQGAAVGMVRTGTRVIDDHGQVQSERTNEAAGLSARDFILAWFNARTSLYLCSTLFHAERLRGVGGFQSRTHLYQDVVAEVILAARYSRVDVPQVKASFRRHGQNGGSAARIADWCEDSLYLVGVMCRELPQDCERLRREGLRYFSRQNYIRASRIPSLQERLRAYGVVFRMLEYSYSPVQFLYRRQVSGLKSRVKQLLGAA